MFWRARPAVSESEMEWRKTIPLKVLPSATRELMRFRVCCCCSVASLSDVKPGISTRWTRWVSL